MTYTSLSRAFAEIKEVSVPEMGRMIGGKVQNNIEGSSLGNSSAIRLSYALNKTGVPIRFSEGSAFSGNDGKRYLYQVSDVEKVAERLSLKIIKGEKISDFFGYSGIIVTKDYNNTHIDLFNGMKVEGVTSYNYKNAILYVI